MSGEDPRVELLGELRRRGYEFTTVTPSTHEIVLSRPLPGRPTLRDIFGWSRPFRADDLDETLLAILKAAGALSVEGRLFRSRVRVSSLGDLLFLHSAFPTDDRDAVFFGPDSYRFVRFVLQHLRQCPPQARMVDMGAGCGVGGIVVKLAMPDASVTLIDCNEAALDVARINAAAAGVEVRTVTATSVAAGVDIVIANPPYMIDPRKRAYRDGGELLGGLVALKWVEEAIEQLSDGGMMLLYTGAAFSGGTSPFLNALRETCERSGTLLSLEDIDPDVFGEELVHSGYETVERIGAFGAVLRVRREKPVIGIQ